MRQLSINDNITWILATRDHITEPVCIKSSKIENGNGKRCQRQSHKHDQIAEESQRPPIGL